MPDISRAIENLILCDDVLAAFGLDWDGAKERIAR